LHGSGSIWAELVRDAEKRGCIFNWNDDGTSSLSPVALLPPLGAGVMGCEQGGGHAHAADAGFWALLRLDTLRGGAKRITTMMVRALDRLHGWCLAWRR